ncbi:MAG: hypothetical protein ACI9UJ_002045 [bacterium]|jgi:uncharacterized protein (DUF2147 family)
MTRFFLCLTASILFSSASFAQLSLVGKWNTGEDNTVVESYMKNGKWYAKIVSSNNKKAVIGRDILIGFSKSDGLWKGHLFAPKKQKILAAKITPKKDVLSITVSSGWISKTIEWQRVKT